jgi:hypothetical protein
MRACSTSTFTTLEKEATGNGRRLAPLLNDFLKFLAIFFSDLRGRLDLEVPCALPLASDPGRENDPRQRRRQTAPSHLYERIVCLCLYLSILGDS